MQDAINILRTNVQPKLQFGYESYKINPANPQPALDTFLQSLALNYGIENNIYADYLSRFVPTFAIVNYDGLLLNVYKKYQGKNGEELDRVWLLKIPFSYSDDEGNVVNFTIDEDIEVYDSAMREWFYGNVRK